MQIDDAAARIFISQLHVRTQLSVHLPLTLAPLGQLLTDRSAMAPHATLDRMMHGVFLWLLCPPPSPDAVLPLLPRLKCLWQDLLTRCALTSALARVLNESFARFSTAIGALASQTNPRAHDPVLLRQQWTHRDYPLFRLHLDARSSDEYDALALPLTLRLHHAWHDNDDGYFLVLVQALHRAATRENGAEVEHADRVLEGLPAALFARYAWQARNLLEECEGALRPGPLPLHTLEPHHFTDRSHYDRLYPHFRLLYFRQVCAARGHGPLATTDTDPLPTSSQFSDLDEHVQFTRIPRPDLDCTAMPNSDFVNAQLTLPPSHPMHRDDPTVRPVLAWAHAVKRAAMADPFLYDRTILQVSDYSALLQALPLHPDVSSVDPLDLCRSLMVLTAALTGRPPAVIFRTHIRGMVSIPPFLINSKTTIYPGYDPLDDSLSYRLPHEWIGYSGSDEHAFLSHCIPTSPEIILPLFPPLVQLYRAWYYRRVLAVDRPQNRPIALFAWPGLPTDPAELEHHVDAWLQSLVPPARSAEWTLRCLANSWWTQATRRFNVDPILATYASCQQRWMTRAPMQYTVIPAPRLARECRRVQQEFWSMMTSTPATNAPATHWWSSLTEGPADAVLRRRTWHGSRCAPKVSGLRRYLAALRQAITEIAHDQDLSSQLEWHNLTTLYVYHGWEFGTLMRPCATPDITLQTVDPTFRHALLRDKDSQYIEDRLAFLLPTLQSLLGYQTQVVNPTTEFRLGQRSILDRAGYGRAGHPLLYFVDPASKAIHSVRPRAIDTVLSRHPELAAHYPFPPNVHRHFMRTWLFARRLGFELSNFVMGHKHFGQEPLHDFAWTDFRRLEEILVSAIEEAFAALGLTPLDEESW